MGSIAGKGEEMKKELLIIIPVYNEEGNIGALLQEMKRKQINELGDILVINDGSTDQTEEIVRENQVEILNKPINMGYGSTLQLGYKYADRKHYDYIIQLDGDGQHSVSNIKPIYKALQGKADIVIGSRFLSQENQHKVSVEKNIAIYFFRKIIKIVTKQDITDPTSGLQGLNREAFSFYAGYGNFDYRYPDINMIMQMLMLGFVIEEIPAKMYPRKTGKSMHAGIIKPIIYVVLMSLSTMSIILRQRKGYTAQKAKEHCEDSYHV